MSARDRDEGGTSSRQIRFVGIYYSFYFTLDESVASWTEKTLTFRCDAIPIPFEHLGDND